MQSVFMKIFGDKSSQNLRISSSICIKQLLEFHPKPDSVFQGLSKLSDEGGLKDDELLDELLNCALGKMD